MCSVDGFLTEAVFTFFRVQKRLKFGQKVKIFEPILCPKNDLKSKKTCFFAAPRDPKNRVFARDFPLKFSRQRFSGCSFCVRPHKKNALFFCQNDVI